MLFKLFFYYLSINAIRILPANIQRKIQIAKFRAIFEYAREHSPFYKKLYEEAGVMNLVVKNYDDIKRIPVIDKIKMKEFATEDILTEQFDPRKHHSHFTSGSTGVPFKIVCSFFEEFCAHVRVFSLMLWSGWRPWHNILMYTRYGSSDKFCVEGKISLLSILNKLGLFKREIVNVFSDPSIVADKLSTGKFKCLWATPGALDLLIDYLDEKRMKLEKIPLVYTYAESVSHLQYTRYMDSICNRVINCYGTEEFPTMGFRDMARRYYNLFANFCLFETEKDEYGEDLFIVTNLENHTMPFIRFNTHDIVDDVIRNHGQVQTLGYIKGRKDDVIKLRSGSSFIFHQSYEMILGMKEVLQYKFVQYKNGDVAIRINLSRNSDKDAIQKTISERWKKTFPNDNLSFEFCDTMSISVQSGKFKVIEIL